MRISKALATALILLSSWAPSWAANQAAAPMSFSVFWPCTGNASFCAPTILAQGVIQLDSDKALERFLANKALHKHQLPPRLRVAFDSPGGSLGGGIRLGRLLRKMQADTVVGSSYEMVGKFPDTEVLVSTPVCASACTLAFAGGVTRSIEEGAKFGVHQFSSGKVDMGEGSAQVAVVVIANYLREMGVDRRMLDVASVVDSKGIYWLSSAQAKDFNIDNTRPPLTAWTINASESGEPYVTTVQRRSDGSYVRVALLMQGSLPIALVHTHLPKISTFQPGQAPLGESAQLIFEIDGMQVQAGSVGVWKKTETAEDYVLEAIGSLTPSQLKRIGAAGSLRIMSGAFSNAIGNLSPETDLSTLKLKSGVALLLRPR